MLCVTIPFMPTDIDLGEYMLEPEVAQLLDVTRSTLQRWRKEHQGPPWIALTDHGRPPIRYPKAAFVEWVEGRIVRPVDR